MAGPTVIPFGHPLAKKVYGGAVFAEVTRRHSFSNRLTGPAPKMGATATRLRAHEQTSADYPFIRVTDLSKEMGDAVSIDLFNILTGKPVMGDQPMAGKRIGLSSSSMDVKIDQSRFGVDPGGRMTQQRTVHDLRTVGKAGIEGLWGRYLDQWKLVHVAGDRGQQDAADWVIPTETDPDFASIMVNAVRRPSYNRHLYAGGAATVEDMDSTSVMSLDDIGRMKAAVVESDMQMSPLRLDGDPAAEEDPLFVLYVTNRQWHWLRYFAVGASGSSWQTFMMNARERGAKNPLFLGNCGMWDGVLVKKMERGIRFEQGSTMTVATNTAAYGTESKTVPTFDGTGVAAQQTADRAILLGSQALAEAWGKDSESGTHFRWFEGKEDDDNRYVASVAGIGGCAKVAFNDVNGVHTDHGVMVLDSYAPDPRHVQLS